MEGDKSDHGISLSRFEMEMPSTSILSRNQKYEKVTGIGQKLTMVASECGMPNLEGNTVPLNLCSYTERTMSKSVMFLLMLLTLKLLTLVLSPTKDRSDVVTYYISYVMFHVAIMHVV